MRGLITPMNTLNTVKFLKARNFLLNNRLDYDKVSREFEWPRFVEFNWAQDWFDVYARENRQTALLIKKDGAPDLKISYAELSRRSDQVARFLQRAGLAQGDRLVVLLPNGAPIWEIMLAAMKIGIVLIPTSTLATKEEIADRIQRSGARFVVTENKDLHKIPNEVIKILLTGKERNTFSYEDTYDERTDYKKVITRANDPLFLYFTSGTTSKAKLVQHTHQSYPIGHLSTMYWIGIKEKDIHQNISSPGWAKHAWSSFFAPFNAGATSFVHDYDRFNAKNTLKALSEVGVNTLCAPPTVWRMMIIENLGMKPKSLREIVSAGEPLNPEVIEKVQDAWGIQIRDGYGQSETTAQIGNTPGQIVKPGSMGRPLPGYQIALLNSSYEEQNEGELSIKLNPAPVSLMNGYIDDQEKTKAVMQKGYYRTGDEAQIDEDGYIFFVGRGDDVFKSSDYRISPFELESALIEHPFVAEAAVVPSPDPVRTSVPKAFIQLKPNIELNAESAKAILLFAKEHLPPYQRIRKIEFSELPKTISGKIRRVELRQLEADRVSKHERGPKEFWLSEFRE
jgi:acetyl-CoA synthetase